MKKFKALTAILLCAVMLVSMTSCAIINSVKEMEKLVGTWVSEPIDVTDAIEESIIDSEDDDFAQYFELGEASVRLVYEFNEDGTYSLNIDETSVDEFVDGVSSSCEDAISKMLNDTVNNAVEENNITVEQLLEAMDYETMDDFINDTLDEFYASFDPNNVKQELIDEIACSGNFTVKDGSIFLLGEEEGTFTDQFNYVLDGDTLTLDVPEEYADEYDYDFPLTFTRQ